MDKKKNYDGFVDVTLTRKTPTSDFLYEYSKEIHKKMKQVLEKNMTKKDFDKACNKITDKYAKIIDQTVDVRYISLSYWKGTKPKDK